MTKLLKLSIKANDIRNKCLSKPYSILEHTFESSDAFFTSFCQVKTKRGTTKDIEQDLLRAMLIFSSAGLDALLKQIVKDALPKLLRKNLKVKNGLENFVQRRIEGDKSSEFVNAKFLSKILTADSYLDKLTEEYIFHLTGNSLQSKDELLKTLYALDINCDPDLLRPKELEEAFKVRNKIIHELDINFEISNRTRYPRARDKMILLANHLLRLAEHIFVCVDKQL